MKSVAFYINCSELTMNEELTLASAINDSLKGQGIAMVNGEKIVFDPFGGGLDERATESVVSGFVAHKKGHELYSVEPVADSLLVHSVDPVAGAREKEKASHAGPRGLERLIVPRPDGAYHQGNPGYHE
ncbi:MAG: hypothetical protein ABSB29_04125 [Nitrososphaerales archaeon]|jgi:hypothetical protein